MRYDHRCKIDWVKYVFPSDPLANEGTLTALPELAPALFILDGDGLVLEVDLFSIEGKQFKNFWVE